MPIRHEFATHTLNASGLEAVADIRRIFSDALNALEKHVLPIPDEQSAETGAIMREVALMRTKLQEASYHAVRAASLDSLFQDNS